MTENRTPGASSSNAAPPIFPGRAVAAAALLAHLFPEDAAAVGADAAGAKSGAASGREKAAPSGTDHAAWLALHKEALARLRKVTGCRTPADLVAALCIRRASITEGSGTWLLPAEVLLKLQFVYGVNPFWVLTGRGSVYLSPAADGEGYVEELWRHTMGGAGEEEASASARILPAELRDADRRARFLRLCPGEALLEEIGRRCRR